MSKLVPVAGPWITQHEIDAVTEAAAHGWYDGAGRFVTAFENAFAARVGKAHAIATPSCTSAIHLALAAWGIGAGDEVVVPELTWIGSSAPISYVGATPVFADVDPESMCVTAETIEAALTERTKAVIAVDLYGDMAQHDQIRALLHERGIHLLEDSAQAIGAKLLGRPAGAWGDVGVFSFHGTKTLTTGEGGMLVTDDPEVHERVLVLRDHGRAAGDHRHFVNREVAFKYRMSSVQAALGKAQLDRLDDLIARRREIFSWYAEELADMPGMRLNRQHPDVFSTYWMVTPIFDRDLGVEKFELMAALERRGIDSRPLFHPLSQQPAYSHTLEAERARMRNQVAYDLSPRGINLPSAYVVDRPTVSRVCVALREAIEEVQAAGLPLRRAAGS